MHLLSGCNMIADIRGTLEAALFCNGQCKVHDMKIGHSNHAETYFPAIYERQNYILCDCPGFLDTRSISQRILNAFSIGKLLSSPCKIKLLLFLTYSHLFTDRGSRAVKLLDEAEKFFCDYNQIEKCIGLVITQVNHDQTVENILDYVMRNRSSKHRLLSYFYKNPQKCFLIYRPTKGEEYKFEYKQKILDFLNDGAIDNPKHNIILDDETLQTLCLICDEMNDKMNDFLKYLATYITEKYKNIKSIDDINIWIKKIEQLRLSATKSIKQFYLDLCKSKEYKWASKDINLLLAWNSFYNQVIAKSTLSFSKKHLFNLNDLLKIFDDQIDDLRNRRNHEESQIQWARDKNVISISNKLNHIVRSGIVENNKWINFFEILEKHPLHYFKYVTKMKNINIEAHCDIEEGVINGKMNNESLKQLVNQLELVIRYLLKTYNFIPTDTNKLMSQVINRLKTTDLPPEKMDVFKKFEPTDKNKAAGAFEMMAHPIKILASIPVGIGHLIKPMLQKKKDIENVNKMKQWYFDGTLTGQIRIFNELVVPFMNIYRDIAKLCDQEYSISFSYGGSVMNGFPFYNYKQIIPNNLHVSIISKCRSMTNILRDTSKNSLEIFNSIYSLYHQVCGEILQIMIDTCGIQQYKAILENNQIDKALDEIRNDLNSSKTSTNDKIVIYSKILATTRMIGAIYGRGIGSQARKDLFCIKTTVNCQSEDGKVCVYNRKNIQDINQNIIVHFQDLVCELKYYDIDVTDFTPDSFVKSSREYIKKFEEVYNQSKDKLNNALKNIFTNLSYETKNSNNSDEKPNPDVRNVFVIYQLWL